MCGSVAVACTASLHQDHVMVLTLPCPQSMWPMYHFQIKRLINARLKSYRQSVLFHWFDKINARSSHQTWANAL